MLIHSGTRTKGTSDQVIRRISTDMEFSSMEAVGDHLAAIFAHAVHHLVRTVNHVQHEERLNLAKPGNLLHHSVII